MVTYTEEAYANTLYNFKYKLDYNDASWVSVFLTDEPEKIPYATNGVLLVFKPNKIEVQRYGAEDDILLDTEEIYLEDGREYDITFGMYKENDTDVRIIIRIDGEDVFNDTVTDSVLVASEFNFGIYSTKTTVVTVGESTAPDESSKYTTVEVADLIADEEGWTAYRDAVPVFENGQLKVTAASGMVTYTEEAYANTLFNFKYKLDYNDASWVSVFLTDKPEAIPYNTNGVLAVFKPNKIELQRYGAKDDFLLDTEEIYLEDGREYDITFGMYKENDTDVRIILRIDGEDVFNDTVTDSVLVESAYNYGIYSTKTTVVTVGESTNTEVSPGDAAAF